MVAIYFHSMESKKTGYPILKMPFCVNRKKKNLFCCNLSVSKWWPFSFLGELCDIYLLTPRASNM